MMQKGTDEKMANSKYLTDEQVEQEIARLTASPLVKLARREEAVRNRRRQYMYQLRFYEKKGKELELAGVTMELLNGLCEEEDDYDVG